MARAKKNLFFFFFNSFRRGDNYQPRPLMCSLSPLFFFFFFFPHQDDIPPGRNTSAEKFPSVMKATKNYERRESSRNATIYAHVRGLFISRDSIFRIINKCYEGENLRCCTHALCSMSFSPRALTNVAKLMTPAFPLLFVQHLERIIRIIKFNRHRDIGIVHAFSYLSSGFLFLGFHRTRCLLGQ